jgi:hypothetical protein
MNKKLVPAIAAFAVLMILAAYLLNGKVLAMVLVLLAALLAKTLIALQQEKLRESEDQADSDSND